MKNIDIKDLTADERRKDFKDYIQANRDIICKSMGLSPDCLESKVHADKPVFGTPVAILILSDVLRWIDPKRV